jgi:hypothetical protein
VQDTPNALDDVSQIELALAPGAKHPRTTRPTSGPNTSHARDYKAESALVDDLFRGLNLHVFCPAEWA